MYICVKHKDMSDREIMNAKQGIPMWWNQQASKRRLDKS